MYQITISSRQKGGFLLETKAKSGGGIVSALYSLKGDCQILGYEAGRFELRLTTEEEGILERKAKKVDLIISDSVCSSLIYSDDLTINVIGTSVLSKALFELHKYGTNLSQPMKFCSTCGLDVFDKSHVTPTPENE